jgi:BMFP domain-containing protein YqiC
MDTKFYQFWGDFVQQALKGQIRSSDLMNLMQQGEGGSDDVTAMFKKYYGLDQKAADAPDYVTLYQESLKHFNKSLDDLFSILDVVPRKDYLDLEQKNKRLEKKITELEAVITHLKVLLKTNSPDAEDGTGPLNQMLKTQNEHFLKMMDSLAEFYGVKGSEDKKE